MAILRKNKFKLYSSLGINLSEHIQNKISKLKKKKWRSLTSFNFKPKKSSEYGDLLLAKQRLKLFYGYPKERQLKNLFLKSKSYKGNQTINFIKLLERRLDIFLLRSKIALSVRKINQLISHGYILVNGIKVTKANYTLKEGDIVSIKNSKLKDSLKKNIKENFNKNITNVNKNILLNHTTFNFSLMKGTLNSLPDIKTISYPFKVDLLSLSEYYKHKKKL